MFEIGQAEIDAVARVIRSGELFRYGPKGRTKWCERFERALARKIGVKYAITTTSGTASLICALTAAGIGPGDEVIVPAYTFIATALAPMACGAVPIIAEIDETLTLDPADVERKISRYTKAVIPVHMRGLPCDMRAIRRIARRRKLTIIEDACQAVGGSYRGKRLGSLGDVGTFSFNFFKNISCGEGGAVLTDDLGLYERAFIQHDGGCSFFTPAGAFGTAFFAGMNFRVSEIQGAILLEQLKRLDPILRRLRTRAAAMREPLAAAKSFRLSRSNDVEGDCGLTIPLLFDAEPDALAFIERHEKDAGLGRPIDTGRHVYSNWEPVMQRRGSYDRRLDPFRLARRKLTYTRDMCPVSTDLMQRTVCVAVPYEATVAEARRVAKRLVE